MLLGYARVSTVEQNEERQIRALLDKGVDRQYIYIDKQSGKDINRQQLNSLLLFAREGDTIITESLSRIARNTKDLLTIIDDLTKRGIEFVSLKENIDTTTPQGKFMLTVFGAMATLERENILERQKEGIGLAKERGVYTGRQRIAVDPSEFDRVVKKWQKGEIKAVDAMKELGLSSNTFYRRCKEKGIQPPTKR